ncbi:hypothetical protein BGZ51_005887 [Haplosporangium sp. Z 767]|nr:hypothetical protein BGZ51_005887 [Haplosporangium sp. Z 767]KAF9184983.1 hypothetical protein BGZ50_003354 [Haplosporangium sp. Z 11]
MHRIFTIAEVFDLILAEITQSDVAHCSSVCRAWLHPCVSRVWHRIEPHQWSHPSLIAALPKYLPYIEELVLDRFASLSLLDNTHGEHQYLTLLTAPSITLENMELTKRILQQNRGIRTLSLQFEYSGSYLKNAGVIEVVTTLQNLCSLSLTNLRIPTAVFDFLLENTPSLKYLALDSCWNAWDIRMKEPEFQNHLRTRPTDRPYSNITTLRLASPSDDFDSLLRITRYTPKLESLILSDHEQPFLKVYYGNPMLETFCQLIREHCPRLHQLTLDQLEAVDSDGFEKLLSAFSGLTSFTVVSHPPSGRSKFMKLGLTNFHVDWRLEVLAKTAGIGETLETLRIEHPGVTVPIGVEVLGLFPQLRHLYIPNNSLHAKQCLEIKWVCTQLETISLTFIGRQGWIPPDKDKETIKDKNKDNHSGTSTQLYDDHEKLQARLAELRHLRRNDVQYASTGY